MKRRWGDFMLKPKANLIKQNLDLATAILLMVGGVYIFYPGAMSGDSLDQWRQVLNPDQIGNWFPPAMVYVWILLNKISYGPQGMLIFHYGLYFASIWVFGRVFIEKYSLRPIYVFALGLFPPIFFLTGVIWKDVSMLGSISLSLGLLFIYEEKRQIPWVSLSILFFTYGISVRHNALVCAIPYSLYLSALIIKKQAHYRRIGIGLLSIILLTGFLFISSFVNNHYVREKNKAYHFENAFLIWDLWGMSLEVNENIIPFYVFSKDFQALGLDTLKKHYTPTSCTVIWLWQYFNPRRWSKRFPDDKFKRDFLNAVLKHPLAYIKVRGKVMLYMMGIEKPIREPFMFRIQRFPKTHYLYSFSKELRSINKGALSSKNTGLLDISRQIAVFCVNKTPLYLVWVYLGLGITQVVFLLRSRHRNRNSNRCLLVLFIGLIYWLPYPIISTSSDFRFSNLTIFCSVAVLPFCIKQLFSDYKFGREQTL